MRLAGKAALVTGASRGIGRAVALALAADGARVCINYLSRRAEAEAVAAACGAGSFAWPADVAEPEQARRLVQAAADRLGGLDILVNNAGHSLDKLLMDTSVAEWDRLMAVHLRGAFNCVQAALPHLLAGGAGRIINISSIWGITGGAGEVAYSAAKAGLIGFTKALARELGRGGVTVNCVAPGAIATDMLAHLSAGALADLAEQTAVGRLGRPEDVAAAVVYLASPAAAFVTGQVLSPNGGAVT